MSAVQHYGTTIFFSLLCATQGLLLSGCRSHEDTSMVGTLERNRVELMLESDEPILGIFAADGAAVAAGDLILKQDPTRARARLAEQQARLELAAAQLAEMRRGTRQEELDESRAQLDAAIAQTRNTLLTVQREQEVFDRGVGNQSSMDDARTRYESALANQQAAQKVLERLLNGATAEQLEQAQARVSVAGAGVAQAQLDLQRTRLLAPVSGTLDKVWLQIGERPEPWQRVAVILDNARSFARVYVPQHLRTRIQPGTQVRVLADNVDQPLSGVVAWVSSDASFTPYFALTEHDRSRLSYLAEIDVAEAGTLPSGLPVTVHID